MTSMAQQAAPGWYDNGAGRQQWWDGNQWTNHFADQQPVQPSYAIQPQYGTQVVVAPAQKIYKTSHGFHLLMSIITLGLWLPVWLIVGVYNASKA